MSAPLVEEAVVETSKPWLPPLRDGEFLDQPTFHARYAAMPVDTRAELIGGVVHMASPVGADHGASTNKADFWLAAYEAACRRVRAYANVTVKMGLASEPQPDGCLRLLPEYGGRTVIRGGYIVGVPELLVEVAFSTEDVDLGPKLADSERVGADEYVVVPPRLVEVRWLVLESGRYEPLERDAAGLFRSRRFPGLCLDPEALLRGGTMRLWEVIRSGTQSAEFTEWMATEGPR